MHTRDLAIRTARATLLLLVQATNVAASQPPRVLLLTDPDDRSAELRLLEGALVESLTCGDRAIVVYPGGAPASAAKADAWREQGDALMNAGTEAFHSLELVAALKAYGKAAQCYDRAAAVSGDPRGLAKALTLTAGAQLLLDQGRRARKALRRVVTLDPCIRPDDTVFNPEMMAVFDELRTAATERTGGSLEVATRPSGAIVFVDNRFAGLAPVTVTGLERGRHFVRAVAKDHEEAARAVDVRPRRARTLSDWKLDEAPLPAPLRRAATVALAGIDAEVLPGAALQLAANTSADIVVLVQVHAAQITFVRFGADGARQLRRTASQTIGGVAAAREVVAALDPFPDLRAGGRAGPPSVEDEHSGKPAAEHEVRADAGSGQPEPHTGANDPGAGSSTAAADAPSRAQNMPESDGEPERRAAASDGAVAGVAPAVDTGEASPGTAGAFALAAHVAYAVAGAAAAGGACFGYRTYADARLYDKLADVGGVIDHDRTTDQVEGQAVAKRVRHNALLADLCYGLAATIAVVGVLMHVLTAPEPTAPSPGAADPATPGADDTRSASPPSLTVQAGPGYLQVRF